MKLEEKPHKTEYWVENDHGDIVGDIEVSADGFITIGSWLNHRDELVIKPLDYTFDNKENAASFLVTYRHANPPLHPNEVWLNPFN